MTDDQRPDGEDTELNEIPETEKEDPIGDETDGEGETAAEPEEDNELETDAEDKIEIGDEEDAEGEAEEEAQLEEQQTAEQEVSDEDEDEPEFKPKARPPAKLERLQKILAQSGVASRRKAEEMIDQGRVQVNGKIVTELGTKADAGRDHIRVDGKLLQGSERLRYFVLNKPRGFVTTVKDPEGRPTVMQFFDKMRERLYPVGRLDYMSEGLLLVTNDGDLANKLTKASVGVEKTYLVKVAGIPTEGELDILRAGVAIEKGKPGSSKVRTSPARIRQVRQGDNPWYEVVLIEGRNRELRKMFEEVGHFVEKIRRVGYGPLILDQEPGNLRELDEQELELLRKAADGKWRTPKAKEIRRRNIVDSLPPEKPAFRPRGERPAPGPKDYKPKKAFESDRPARSGPAKSATGAGRPGAPKFGPAKFGPGTGAGRPARPAAGCSGRFGAEGTGDSRPPAGRTFGDRPSAGRTFGAKPGGGRPYGDKPAGGRSFPAKPAWKKPEAGERPPYKKPFSPRPEASPKPFPKPEPMDEIEPRKPFKIHIEPVADFERSERPRSTRHESDRGRSERPRSDRPGAGRPPTGYSGAVRTGPGRPAFGRPGADRPGSGRTGGGGSSAPRPFRSESGLGRPASTRSGKPRAGGARPSSKPGGRSFGGGAGRSGPRSGGDSRPSFGAKRPFEGRSADGPSGPAKRTYTPRPDGGADSRPERRTGTGWKPKPNFSGKAGGGKPGGPRPGGGSRPKSGGPAKSGFKGKPGGKRPGGKRP